MKMVKTFLSFFYKKYLSTSRKENFFLVIFSIIISASNILIPILEKLLIDSNNSIEFLSVSFFCISILFFLSSYANCFLISKIYYIFKRKLENQLLHSIAIKDAAIITSRGSGAFLGSIFGDSEQISSSLAVNYFAILLDFLSSIISIIIGGLWNLSFALIVSVALLVMFAVIVIANNISIRNFKKGKEMIYQINPRILEMIENRDTIMSNASFSKYQEKEVSNMYERDKYFQKSNNASLFSSVLLKAIPFISLSVFFFFLFPA